MTEGYCVASMMVVGTVLGVIRLIHIRNTITTR